MSNLCIIPARGGSKRIPSKNIKDFLGKPIIAYSIEAAIKSTLFDEIMVSTDDDEIAQIAHQYGAKTPFTRSSKNSNDYATTYDVIEEVLQDYKNNNQLFDYACCIYPTAPFVNKHLLCEAQQLLITKNFDCVFPCIEYPSAIERAFSINKENNRISLFSEKSITCRSQDLEQWHYDAGQFYFFNTEAILTEKKLWTTNTSSLPIDQMQAQDIDTLNDWKFAELKYNLL